MAQLKSITVWDFIFDKKLDMELFEIIEQLSTEKKAYQFLESLRWPIVVCCPYCNCKRSSGKPKENRYKCHGCNRSFSVLVGTIFESSKLPIRKWILAMKLICDAKKGISSLQLSRHLNVNRNTAWFIQKRIRNAMKESNNFLKGIVEVDESYIGGTLENKHFHKKKKRNYHKSGMEHKKPILGMIERKGKVIAKVLDKAHGKTIKPILKDLITPTSTVVTDGFGGYYGISNYFEGHIILNHTKHVRKINNYHLNTIEGFWTMIKRAMIGQYHKITAKYLQSYIDEITFKYNYRETCPFNELMKRVFCGTCAIF